MGANLQYVVPLDRLIDWLNKLLAWLIERIAWLIDWLIDWLNVNWGSISFCSTTTTRDLTIYNLEVTRDNLYEALKFLSYVVTQQEFKSWEVMDSRERMLVELAILGKHPEIRGFSP